MRRIRTAAVIGLVVAAIGAFLAATPLGLALEEGVALKWLFALRGAIDPPGDALVVSADGKAAELFELFPEDAAWQRCLARVRTAKGDVWPRCVQARLIRALARAGAAVIVFDVSFNEARIAEHDAELARALGEAENVVLFERLSMEDLAGGAVRQETLIPPLPRFFEAARGAGPFPLPKLPARVNQFWAFKTSIGDTPTLPVVALQVQALPLLDRFVALLERAGVDWPRDLPRDAAKLRGPNDLRPVMRALRRLLKGDRAAHERVLAALGKVDGAAERALLLALARVYYGPDSYYLNLYGPAHTLRTLQGHQVLSGAQGAADLSGKAVFVGTSLLAYVDQEDGFYTVYTRDDGIDLSGVEIGASAFANLASGRVLRTPGAAGRIAVPILFGIAVGVLAYLLAGLRAAAATLVVAGLYFWVVQQLFAREALWLSLAVPTLVQLPLGLLLGLTWQYFGVRRARAAVGRAIRYYVPDRVAESLERDERLDTRAELVYCTCLATDAQQFTTVSERLDPQQLAALMNEYFERLGEPVIEHQGSVAEVIADSMMCVWVAEETRADKRLQACRAALGICRAVDLFNQRHRDYSLPTRIGLHAGSVGMGNVGGGGRYAFSLVGDLANTTSRIESLNKYLGTRLLASGSVVDGLDGLVMRRLGNFILKGKVSPLAIFEILAEPGQPAVLDGALRRDFSSALKVFEAERWREAAERFAAVHDAYPDDGPTRFYLERARHNCSTPPPAGDNGVVRMESK